MAVERIIEEKCIGCGTCVKACQMDVFRMEGKKAVVKYPLECVMCSVCLGYCPQDAIYATFGRLTTYMTSGY